MALEGNQKKFDIFTLVILLLVLALIMGGQWLAFNALESKFDELAARLDVPTATLDSKLENIREDIRGVKRMLSGHTGSGAAPSSGAPATAAADPGK